MYQTNSKYTVRIQKIIRTVSYKRAKLHQAISYIQYTFLSRLIDQLQLWQASRSCFGNKTTRSCRTTHWITTSCNCSIIIEKHHYITDSPSYKKSFLLLL